MAEEAAQGVENLSLAADGGKKNRIQVSNTKRPVSSCTFAFHHMNKYTGCSIRHF